MERTRRVIRPPQAGDVWYVRLHAEACTPRLDEVEIVEKTAETVLLKVRAELDSPAFVARFCTADVRFVEFVRELPRAVTSENLSCLMPRLDPMAHPSEPRHRAAPRPEDLSPRPPPMNK